LTTAAGHGPDLDPGQGRDQDPGPDQSRVAPGPGLRRDPDPGPRRDPDPGPSPETLRRADDPEQDPSPDHGLNLVQGGRSLLPGENPDPEINPAPEINPDPEINPAPEANPGPGPRVPRRKMATDESIDIRGFHYTVSNLHTGYRVQIGRNIMGRPVVFAM